jgi:DNA helicase-2/ATP-dependent DNA helicase PcrA
LFYVACTRARERLFLLDTANGKGPGSRSRFLRDLDAGKAIMPVSIKDIPQSVWRISRKDLEERDPPPLQIGLSDLIMYLECPYQFGLRAIVGVQPAVGEELGFGKSLHELIRRRHDSGRAWTDSERRRQVTTHVKVPYMSADAEVQVRRAIAARMAGLEELGAFQRVTAAEIPFNVVLDAGIVKGNVDCVLKDEDGTLSIRDWKSSIHPQFVARYELQLQFYAYALRCQNVEVVYADMVDVAASARTGHLVARPVDLGRAALERLSTRFQNAVHGIRAGDFSATPSPDSCGACDIYRICAVRWNLETSDEQ